MRINNNLLAMNAHRNALIVGNRVDKSIKKLASGKRINGAADDAAGLSISKKMRAQIRGMNQASRNIQDGISLIQTAEGALSEVHSLIQRGRELAVQASNDTFTADDRQKIQEEYIEIQNEVDRISAHTEFNTKKILNVNDATTKALKESIIQSLKDGWLESAANMVNTHYGLSPSTRTIDVNLYKGGPAGTLASVSTGYSVSGDTATVSSMTLNIDLTDFAPNTGADGENYLTNNGSFMYNDRIIAHEMVHAIMADQMGDDFFDMPTWFKEGTAEFIHGADDRVESDGLAASVARAEQLIAGASWTGSSLDYSASYIAVKFLHSELNSGRTMSNIMSDIQDGNNANDNTMGAILSNTSFTDLNDFRAQLVANGASIINITPGAGEADTGAIGGSDYGGGAKTPSSVVPTGSTSANPTNFNFVMPDTSAAADGPVKIHSGANSGQSLEIELTNISSADLGIASLDFVNNPNAAISAFNDAINAVSTQRSKFGALQNRLEYAHKVATNYAENLQASESRISDVDVAAESMAFTKNNVLNQAAQAMLAQANQVPQGVLRLLN